MSERELNQAEELDRYLTELQAGRQPGQPAGVAVDEADLLARLVALAEAQEPEAAASARLAGRLRSAAAPRRRLEEARSRRRPLQRLADLFQGVDAVSSKSLVIMAGAVALAIIVIVGLVALGGLPAQPEQVAGPPTALPTATMATAGGQVTAGAETPAPTPVGSPVVAVEPAATATPWAGEPPALPPLAVLIPSGMGGSLGELVVGTRELVLQAELPEAPAAVPALLRREAGPLTIEAARLLAERLGLAGLVYQPLWMTQPESRAQAARLSYVVIDDPAELSLEGRELWRYRERRIAPGTSTTFPPLTLPSAEEAVAEATAFLERFGLLQSPYRTELASDSVAYYRQVEGVTLSLPYAIVRFWPEGGLREIEYRPIELDPAGSYRLISAAEAWALVEAGDPRVWYEPVGESLGWGEWGLQGDTRFWSRVYPAGQPADVLGAVQAVWAAEAGYPPHATVNGLVLEGALEPLLTAQLAAQERTMDSEAPLHVWGTVRDAGGYLALQVAGFEDASQGPTFWTGTVERRADGALLRTDDEALLIADLPLDLPDGTRVYVRGGLVEGRIEWSSIQTYLEDAGYPAAAERLQALVEQVELIYYLPLEDAVAPEQLAQPGYRVLQPVWRFSGHLEGGQPFGMMIQAAAPEHLSGG